MMVSPLAKSADDVLAGFPSDGEKATYCFYSESMNVQMAARGSDPMAALGLIQTVQAWQNILNTLLPDRDTRNQRMVTALQEFNRRQAQFGDSSPNEAKRKVVEQNASACKALLAQLQSSELKPETMGGAAQSQTSKKASPQETPKTPAETSWFDRVDYTGAWQTTRVMRQFPYANTIVFELWKGVDNKPHGIALFVGEDSECAGELGADGLDGLSFTPMEDNACASVKPGRFKLVRDFGAQAVMLVFVPKGEADTPQLIQTNAASFRRLPTVPATLQAMSAKARGSGDSINASLREALQDHAETVAKLRKALQGEFRPRLSESKLIGVWRGEFIDALQTYPAEIALWSVKDMILQKLNGVVRFDGGLCTASIQVNDTGTIFTWTIGNNAVTNGVGDCEPISATGSLRMNPAMDRIAIGLGPQQPAQGSMSARHCLRDLPNIEIRGDCAVAGVFTRAAATAGLDQTIAAIASNQALKAPAAGHWSILRRNDAGLAQLHAAHDDALKENARFLAEREKNYAEAEKRREQEYQEQQRQRREQQAREKARREQVAREWEARRGAPPGAAGGEHIVLPELPSVSGPFDGLRGGDFLNALYHQDFAAIGTFDRYYQQRKIKQRRDWVGKHWSDNVLDAAVKSMRLADTVLTLFLFNYDSKYQACLKDDAVTFKVVKVVPDVVVENLIGVEVSRFYGYTERRFYKINEEFTTAFRRVGTTEPEGGMATLSDFLLNQGGTDLRRELLAGTRQMMDRFSCDSAPIRRIEQSLLQFSTR